MIHDIEKKKTYLFAFLFLHYYIDNYQGYSLTFKKKILRGWMLRVLQIYEIK
jgi:hypothetical protein